MKGEKFWKGYYAVIFIIGLALILLQVTIYRKTIIDIYIPILIILVTGLLTFYFNRHHYKKTFLLKGNLLPLMQNFMSWGFICCYFFMATNYYFSEGRITKYKFPIKEKSSMPGRKYHRNERQPLVRIDYFNYDKELVFSYADTEKVNRANSVWIDIRKGWLGFDILECYDVVQQY